MIEATSIADRLAIEERLYRYVWALDTGDVEATVACFTSDCRVVDDVFEDIDIWEGGDGIRAMTTHYNAAPGFPGRQHHVTNMIVDRLEGDQAEVRSFIFITECRDEPPFLLRFAGYYTDQFERRDGEWLIHRRTIRMWSGDILARFPGHAQRVARQRPPELAVKQRAIAKP